MPTVRAYGPTDDDVVDRVRDRLEADDLTPTRVVVDVAAGFVEVELPAVVPPLVESAVRKALVEELPPPPAVPPAPTLEDRVVELTAKVADLEATIADLTARVETLEGPPPTTEPAP